MRLKIAALIALMPVTATAGGHGTFYNCEAAGIQDFTIEIAARDCMVGRTKATKAGENPDVCEFGDGGLGTVTLEGNGALTVVAGGKTFTGQCRPR